jgi:hypothetical protein
VYIIWSKESCNEKTRGEKRNRVRRYEGQKEIMRFVFCVASRFERRCIKSTQREVIMQLTSGQERSTNYT